MKTNTIKSIAALFSAAAILSSAAFAGPGPQDHSVPTRTISATTTIAVMPATRTPVAEHKSAASSTQRTPHLVYSPHGGVTVL